jgi:hydroxyacylglutathione hydrolase
MLFETFPVGLLQCNCAILGDEETRDAVVIDPGEEVDRILEALKRHDLKLRKIINTHTHIDHVGANAALRERTGAEVCLHKADVFLLENLEMQAAMIGLPAPPPSPVDAYLESGDTLTCGSLRFGVLHTPGHTPGSLTFDTELDGRGNIETVLNLDFGRRGPAKDKISPSQILFTGDTLFASSIGRTDLWGGSLETIMCSLATMLRKYDDSTLVLPGHGPATTIGRERRSNPFLQEL